MPKINKLCQLRVKFNTDYLKLLEHRATVTVARFLHAALSL